MLVPPYDLGNHHVSWLSFSCPHATQFPCGLGGWILVGDETASCSCGCSAHQVTRENVWINWGSECRPSEMRQLPHLDTSTIMNCSHLMGFPQSWGYPNSWMLYFMEHPQITWMIWGYHHFRKLSYGGFHKWGSNHPFLDGIFPSKPSIFGYHHFTKLSY